MFISNQNRQRHKLIDKALGAAKDTLANPEVARRLGDRAEVLRDIDSRLFVPDVRDGSPVRIPGRQRRLGGVPVIALMHDERVRLSDDFSNLNPQQRSSAIETLAKSTHASKPRKALDFKMRLLRGSFDPARSDVGVPSIDADDIALVFSRVLQRPNEKLYGWPLLVLNPGKEDVLDNNGYGPVVVHEYTHVWQHERRPLFLPWEPAMDIEDGRRCELEALSVGAMAVEGLRASGLECTDRGMQLSIDIVRRQVNAGQPDEWAGGPLLALGLRQLGVSVPALAG